MKKRAGFTMIELIFVIVILGILAAVAIPKLAATRDDAQISKIVTNITTAQGEISGYTLSQGTAPTDDANLSLASNVIKLGIDTNYVSTGTTVTVVTAPGIAARFTDDQNNTCATIELNSTTMAVIVPTAPVGNICGGVAAQISDGNVSIAGARVRY